jgi:hypothetical protein
MDAAIVLAGVNSRSSSAVPKGTRFYFSTTPALKRWAKLFRAYGALVSRLKMVVIPSEASAVFPDPLAFAGRADAKSRDLLLYRGSELPLFICRPLRDSGLENLTPPTVETVGYLLSSRFAGLHSYKLAGASPPARISQAEKKAPG